MVTRRVFLQSGALAVVGTAAIPSFLTRAAFAADSVAGLNKRLVVLFQRGAADGLNIVVPHGERAYYAMRPTINIPKKQVVDLDGFFGLHPSMSAFKPFWDQKQLAIVHAAGSPDPTRSHFDAQDYMESGTPGLKSTSDGWLNRALHTLPAAQSKSAFRAIALGPSLPRILSGGEAAIAVNNVADFGVGGRNPNASPAANSFEAMYQQSVDTVLHGTGKETFEAVKMLKSADPARYKPAMLLLMAGDTISPSVESITYKGAQMIEAWNAIGLDYATYGNHEFDPVRVGYVDGGPSKVRTSQAGNRNTGHLFETPATPAERHPGTIGPYLTPEERMALIEYLKTL